MKVRKIKGAGGSSDHPRFSLIRILFQSIVVVMVAVFMAVQLLGILPEAANHTLGERMSLGRLVNEASDNLALIFLIMAFMALGIYLALKLGLRPLRRISDLAAEIGPATISKRLPLRSTPREIAPLVVAFNAALDRIESGWRAQQEFSANAAHELRTPLAALRAQVESLLDAGERRDAMEEFDRLSRLITQLLALAEAERAQELQISSFDLVELARHVTTEMASPMYAGDRIISFEAAVTQWRCHGSSQLVELAIRNLFENAVRHAGSDCEISVGIDPFGRLTVTDDGPGVPEYFRANAFDRFTKVSSNSVGAGLGLSIVQRIMNFHCGEARIETLSKGARFILDFSGQGSRELPDHHRSTDSTSRRALRREVTRKPSLISAPWN